MLSGSDCYEFSPNDDSSLLWVNRTKNGKIKDPSIPDKHHDAGEIMEQEDKRAKEMEECIESAANKKALSKKCKLYLKNCKNGNTHCLCEEVIKPSIMEDSYFYVQNVYLNPASMNTKDGRRTYTFSKNGITTPPPGAINVSGDPAMCKLTNKEEIKQNAEENRKKKK